MEGGSLGFGNSFPLPNSDPLVHQAAMGTKHVEVKNGRGRDKAHNRLLQGSSVIRSKSRPSRDQASFQQDGSTHMPGVYFLSTLSGS